MFLNSIFQQTSLFKDISNAKKDKQFPLVLTGLNPTLKALIVAGEEKATVITADAAESHVLLKETEKKIMKTSSFPSS